MLALFLRDIRLSWRAGGGVLTALLFFLALVAVIPFGVGPDLNLLARIGPAILWVGALFSALLGLDRLFQADRDDGSLGLIVMADERRMLALTVLIKCLAHWVVTALPLVVASPFLGLMMNMDAVAIGATTLTLLAGTPAIAFIGATGAAVAVSLPRAGVLVTILVLPLVIPVLIFGVSAAYGAVNDPQPFWPPFLILCALSLGFAVIGPFAAALALKGGE